MKDFLTLLYFEKFTLNKREQELMNISDYPDTKEGIYSNIRNDQSIVEVRKQQQMVDKFIIAYLETIG